VYVHWLSASPALGFSAAVAVVRNRNMPSKIEPIDRHARHITLLLKTASYLSTQRIKIEMEIILEQCVIKIKQNNDIMALYFILGRLSYLGAPFFWVIESGVLHHLR
jgi:hypothetical protein